MRTVNSCQLKKKNGFNFGHLESGLLLSHLTDANWYMSHREEEARFNNVDLRVNSTQLSNKHLLKALWTMRVRIRNYRTRISLKKSVPDLPELRVWMGWDGENRC